MNLKRTAFALLLISILCFSALLAGCKPEAETPPLVTEDVQPTVQPSPTATDVNAGIQEYANPGYGFAFTYPPGWSLAETESSAGVGNHALRLQHGSIELWVEYGFAYEIEALETVEQPLGELVERGSVSFLEAALSSSAVADGEQVKMVFYPAPADILRVDDLFFHIRLQETAALAQNEIEIPAGVLAEAEEILAGFTRIERSGTPPDPHPGWETYINLDYGFSLRYPETWQAEELQIEISPTVFEDTLRLTTENMALFVGFHFSAEYLPRTINFPGGLLVDSGQIVFLGQPVDKLKLVYGEKDKVVFYNGMEDIPAGEISFHLMLRDDGTGEGYEQIEIPQNIQIEAESILTTLRQFGAAGNPPAAGVKSEGKERFLTFGSCFDLDEGMEKASEDAACDFRIEKAASGGLQIDFQPQSPAAFGFDDVFVEQPQVSQCAASDGLSSQLETVAPLAAFHVCYQTNAGRFGYLAFQAITSDGVTFNWQTFTHTGPFSEAQGGQNAAITIKDVTVPDGTVFEPGETFLKTWQLMNTGESTWTTDYAMRFKEGERMGSVYEAAMPRQVPPRGTVNVSIEMTAPMEPGEYTSHWVLRDAAGREFGVGEGGKETFWATIVVEEDNAQEEEEGEVSSGDTPVKTVTLEVDPSSFSGACPATLTVIFNITSEGVSGYTYELEAGAEQAGYQFYLPGAQTAVLEGSSTITKTVEYSITLQNSVSGWLRVLVTDPGLYRSEKVFFTIECD